MNALLATVLAVVLALGASAPARAAGAHEHGVARLGIAVEPRQLSVDIELAVDDLVGFERAPRSEAERRRAEQALATLREPGRWLQPDPAAQCSAGTIILEPNLLDGRAPARDGHADLHASASFDCARPPAFVDVRLFDAFARLQRIELQVAAPAGQSRSVLRRPAGRIVLPAR